MSNLEKLYKEAGIKETVIKENEAKNTRLVLVQKKSRMIKALIYVAGSLSLIFWVFTSDIFEESTAQRYYFTVIALVFFLFVISKISIMNKVLKENKKFLGF